MSETPKQWAKRMWEINQNNPQFALGAFIERYRERKKDYGALKCYGPFTDQELDEYDISHAMRMSAADAQWMFSFDLNATREEIMTGVERFVEECRPEQYKQYKYKGAEE